ncbi:MAG: hypothetical protein RL011_304 [Pseudomonadota bacterium]|jgi:hypothetical protein
MNTAKLRLIPSIIGITLSIGLAACGHLDAKTGSQTKNTSQQSSNAGSASLQIADLSSLGDVKKVRITVTSTSTSSQGGSYFFTQTDDYKSGQNIVVANLPERAYTVTLEVLDGSGKVLATGVASNVQIKNGSPTSLNIALSKTGPGGTLVVGVVPPKVSVTTIASLIGTGWTQANVPAHFSIGEKSVGFSYDCNSMVLGYIFAPDGTILGDGSGPQFQTHICAGGPGPNLPAPRGANPDSPEAWKSYVLQDDKLIITTKGGATHTFIRRPFIGQLQPTLHWKN